MHFPLAFLRLANVLNLLYGTVLYFPNNPFFSRDQENLVSLSILDYASNLLGIITSIPAVLTGGMELYAMINSNGVYQTDEKGEKKLVPKVKIALMHPVSTTSSSQVQFITCCNNEMSLAFDQRVIRS